MKKYVLIIAVLLVIVKYGSAQIFDKYGLNIGVTYSNQLWNYKIISIDNSAQEYKTGLSVFLSAEKKLNKIFSFRPEFGYLQKGFKNNLELRFADGTIAGVTNKNVILHDLGLNIGVKVSPFNLKWAPYILLGLRGDYMISYKDIVFDDPNSGLEINMYKAQIEEFKKINVGGLLGFGIEFNNLYYIEFEYNPSLTNSYNSVGLQIKDNCYGLKFGLNINKWIK